MKKILFHRNPYDILGLVLTGQFYLTFTCALEVLQMVHGFGAGCMPHVAKGVIRKTTRHTTNMKLTPSRLLTTPSRIHLVLVPCLWESWVPPHIAIFFLFFPCHHWLFYFSYPSLLHLDLSGGGKERLNTSEYYLQHLQKVWIGVCSALVVHPLRLQVHL